MSDLLFSLAIFSFCSFRFVWYHVFRPIVKMQIKASRIKVAASPADFEGPKVAVASMSEADEETTTGFVDPT